MNVIVFLMPAFSGSFFGASLMRMHKANTLPELRSAVIWTAVSLLTVAVSLTLAVNAEIGQRTKREDI